MPKIKIKIAKEVSLDKELCELAGCKINTGKVPGNKNAIIRFNPTPSIWAKNNMFLAHEICHLLAGKEDYDLYVSTTEARNCKIFDHVLNTLFDEYHESLHGQRSDVLYKHLSTYHRNMKYKPMGIPVLDEVLKRFMSSVPGEKMGIHITEASDLVTIADHITKEVLPKQMADRNLTKDTVLRLMDWAADPGDFETKKSILKGKK